MAGAAQANNRYQPIGSAKILFFTLVGSPCRRKTIGCPNVQLRLMCSANIVANTAPTAVDSHSSASRKPQAMPPSGKLSCNKNNQVLITVTPYGVQYSRSYLYAPWHAPLAFNFASSLARSLRICSDHQPCMWHPVKQHRAIPLSNTTCRVFEDNVGALELANTPKASSTKDQAPCRSIASLPTIYLRQDDYC